MNSAVYFQQLLHGLCEWGVAFAVAYWLAQSWTREPASFGVRMVRLPERFWLAMAFGIGPAVLSIFLRQPMMNLYTHESWAVARLPVGYALSIIYGALVGLAASCAVAPATAKERFRTAAAGGTGAALIIVSYLLGSVQWFRPLLHATIELVGAVAVLSVAYACVQAQPGISVEAVSTPPRRSPALALIVGFLPSVLVLATIGVASSTNLGKQESDALLWLGSIVSVFCCFGASIALFTRKTGGAIAGGILLLLLNAFIAFFFGCCATVNLSSMH
jgi:hypothetical protein